MSVRPLVLVGAIAVCLAQTACSTSSPSASDAAPASSTPAGAAASGSSASSPQGTTPSSASAHVTTAAATVASTGQCSTIDQATAATILGFATKTGVSSKASSADPRFLKLDGCLYESATSGSLGYTVVKVDAAAAAGMVAAAKAKMAGAGSQVAVFTPGIANSVAFTMHLPHGVDSQITAQAGDRLLSVASTRKDGDAAKSQASATAAMQALIAAG
jgi:hypothetical protein